MSIETVVVAVETEETALLEKLATTTRDIAEPAASEVVFARVYTDEEYENARESLGVDADSEVTPDTIVSRNQLVRTLEEPLTAAGIDIDSRGRLENGATKGEKLTVLSDEVDADLLIIGGEDRTPVGKAVFGSMAQEVMLEAPCPVTFVRAE